MAGLIVYGCGALLAAFAQGLGLMIVGYSLLEGIGSALMIPPIYILITVAFTDTRLAGQVLRRRQRGRRSGRGRRTADRRPGDQRDQLACLLHPPGAHRGDDHRDGATASSTRPVPKRPRSSTCSARSCRRSVCSSSCSGILQSSTYGWFAARTDFTIGDTVVIPEGGISPVWIFVGNRRGDPALVLPAPAVAGAQGRGPAHRDAAVPQPDVKPRPRARSCSSG